MKVLFFLALLCIAFYVSAEDEAVITLTKDNFDEVVLKAPIILVEFYAPWCGHCKHLAPEYEAAAKKLKAEGIPLGKVDATEEIDLAMDYEVTGYPTLLVFKNGNPTPYEGTRQADGIVSYMRKKAGPASRKITTEKEIDQLLARDVAVISYGDASAEFERVAEAVEEAGFGEVVEKSLRGENEGKVVLYRKEDSREFVFEGGDFEKFVRLNSFPVAGEMTRANLQQYATSGVPRLTLYFNVDYEKNVKRTNYFKRRAFKVGSEFEGKIVFAIADKDSAFVDPSSYGTSAEDLGEYFITLDSGADKYLYSDVYDKFNVANLRGFAEKYLNGELEVYLKSQPVPEDNGPVTVVVGKTFNDIVFDDSKNVLIEFYAPWCGHCKSLEPKYTKLGESFEGNDKVVIAKLDATANDWDKNTFDVRGFPTIYFKPAGAGSKILKYSGEREVDSFKKFINANGNF